MKNIITAFIMLLLPLNGVYADHHHSAMKVILEAADDKTQIIPGHGGLATKDDMQKDKKMLENFVNEIKKQ